MKEKETSKLYNSLTNVDNQFIEEAQTKAMKKNGWLKWFSIAACLCLVVAAFAGYGIKMNFLPPISTEHTDIGDNSIDGDPNDYVPGTDSQTSNDTKPVYYSNLMLAAGELNEEALALSDKSTIDVLAFDEAMLSQDECSMIIEGTVVNLYVKHYDFDVYYDKFDESDVMHLETDTVVYEIAVDKTWFGEDISGETILIEDTAYFGHPILAVKTGLRYVLPICEYGETVWTLGHEYAGGDITRESLYCTVYPDHPQIEVTNDGSYLVSGDWTTLITDNAKEVIMDTLDDGDYWKDKMYLVEENTFADQMDILCRGIK